MPMNPVIRFRLPVRIRGYAPVYEAEQSETR